jgi:DNA transformation protein
MAATPALVAHCIELFGGPARARSLRMFGGHGVYVDGLFLALVAFDRLYLKADAQAQPAFASAGCQPFTYAKKTGEQQVMAYWTAPDEAMDSPEAMQPWLRLAMASALRAQAAKAPAAPRKARAAPVARRTRQA